MLFPVFLIAIDCQQYAGNDNDKKGASNPGRNMEEADDCSKMENYVVAEIGNFHPCFSPGEKSSYVEDFSNTLDITDESALDGEVGKRLNQMVPVPVSFFFSSLESIVSEVLRLETYIFTSLIIIVILIIPLIIIIICGWIPVYYSS